MTANIYQIYYSEKTRSENDPGFFQLDNFRNERPDWREYWPIRSFLLNNQLKEDEVYGFFSPKFKLKTGLSSSDVINFIGNGDADVYTFSPYFDQSAFFSNIFEQGWAMHEGFTPVAVDSFKELNANIDVSSMLMTSKSTVFCNFFVAKPRFWRVWLAACEKIFSIAESGETALSKVLSENANHGDDIAQFKVFVIERVASFILTLQQWNVVAYDSMKLPYSSAKISEFVDDLCILDALKIAYCSNGFSEYMSRFNAIRADVINRAMK